MFYFPLQMYDRESIVLGSSFLNGDFDEFTHLGFPDNEINILSC